MRPTATSSSDLCSDGEGSGSGSRTGSSSSGIRTSVVVHGRMPWSTPDSSRVTAWWRALAGGPLTYAALNRSSVDWSGLRNPSPGIGGSS